MRLSKSNNPMEKLSVFCDVCDGNIPVKEGKHSEKIMVVMTTEQNEGRATEPYLQIVDLDICGKCKSKVISGKMLFAEGAMGHNKYFFKKRV